MRNSPRLDRTRSQRASHHRPRHPGVHDILTGAERPGSGVLARKLFVGLTIELMGESQ
ncbi:MAG TPA: hypothetical protein VGG82_13285 [Casimicrobiaceae bacterium]